MSTGSGPPRVLVVGGGITGLAAAYRLRELRPDVAVELWESQSRLGGVIRTERIGEYLVESGADMFTTKETWGVDLCRRLGMHEQLLNTNKRHARAFVVYRGRLHPVPEGFALMTPRKAWPIATTSLLGLGGKLRMAYEYFVPAKRDDEEESLAQFATRRLGRQVYERLVQPLVGGIYTADPTKLSVQAALPQFAEMERQHGGLIRATWQGKGKNDAGEPGGTGARYGLFVAPREGMQSLLDGLASRLPPEAIRLATPVAELKRDESGRWLARAADSDEATVFDAVILAVPAQNAARLLAAIDVPLAEELRSIPYASAAIAVMGYRRSQIDHALDGFGVVVPQCERRQILAASFASNKFPGRAPDDRVLIRVFVGGACQPDLVEWSDEELRALCTRELDALLRVQGEPELFQVVRWRDAMPQYHVGHLGKIRRIDDRMQTLPTLALAGNAYRGVGIPYCIHSGELAAERILSPQSR